MPGARAMAERIFAASLAKATEGPSTTPGAAPPSPEVGNGPKDAKRQAAALRAWDTRGRASSDSPAAEHTLRIVVSLAEDHAREAESLAAEAGTKDARALAARAKAAAEAARAAAERGDVAEAERRKDSAVEATRDARAETRRARDLRSAAEHAAGEGGDAVRLARAAVRDAQGAASRSRTFGDALRAHQEAWTQAAAAAQRAMADGLLTDTEYSGLMASLSGATVQAARGNSAHRQGRVEAAGSELVVGAQAIDSAAGKVAAAGARALAALAAGQEGSTPPTTAGAERAAKAVAPVDPEAILKAAVADFERAISPSAAAARAKKAWEKRHAAGERARLDAPRPGAPGPKEPEPDVNLRIMRRDLKDLHAQVDAIPDTGKRMAVRAHVARLENVIADYANALVAGDRNKMGEAHREVVHEALGAKAAISEAQAGAAPAKPEDPRVEAYRRGHEVRERDISALLEDAKQFNLPAAHRAFNLLHEARRLGRKAVAEAQGRQFDVANHLDRDADRHKLAAADAIHEARAKPPASPQRPAAAGKPDDTWRQRIEQVEQRGAALERVLGGMRRDAAEANVPRGHRIFVLIYDAGRRGREALAAAHAGNVDRMNDLVREADQHRVAAEGALREFTAERGQKPENLDAMNSRVDEIRGQAADARRRVDGVSDGPLRQHALASILDAHVHADVFNAARDHGDWAKARAAYEALSGAHAKMAEAVVQALEGHGERAAGRAAIDPVVQGNLAAVRDDIKRLHADLARLPDDPARKRLWVLLGDAQGAADGLEDAVRRGGEERMEEANRRARADIAEARNAIDAEQKVAAAAHLAKMPPRDQVRTVVEGKARYAFNQHPDLLVSAMRETPIDPVGSRVVATVDEIDAAGKAVDLGDRRLQERNMRRATDERASLKIEAVERGEREGWREHYRRVIRMANSITDWNKAVTRGNAFSDQGMLDAARLFQHRGALLYAAKQRGSRGT